MYKQQIASILSGYPHSIHIINPRNSTRKKHVTTYKIKIHRSLDDQDLIRLYRQLNQLAPSDHAIQLAVEVQNDN